MDKAFLKERIEKTKLLIVAYEDALTALTVDGIESYTLDTGQTRQTVTLSNQAAMQRTLDGLYSRLDVFTARLCGGGTTNMVPDW